MKKVLFISSRPIYPVIGGDQIRTSQQLEYLVQRYIVDVIYLSENSLEDQTKKYLPAVRNVKCFRLSKFKSYFQTLCFLFNKLPLQVNYYYDKRVYKYIATHLHDYDIVFCNNIRTAEYVRNTQNIVKYIDFVDAISMNYNKAKKLSHGFKKLIYTIDSNRCVKYEQLIIEKFDSCAIISDIDKKYIIKCQQTFMSSEIK